MARLMPVQPNGKLPLNFFEVEAPPTRPIEAHQVVERPMNEDRIRELSAILQKYKEGKANLENRIISNEEWWKLRNWEQFRRGKEPKSEIEPTSAYLFNALVNKLADAMDNFPRCNILPREEGDKQEAKTLSSILPVILDMCGFEQTYSDVWGYKLKTGTGAYAVLWNKSLSNGLGDVDITKVDLLNLFWEPGITDIQDSPYLFITTVHDNAYLEGRYPELQGKLGGQGGISVSKYIYDENIDTTDKTVVVDCYYKVQVGDQTVLHLVKFVGDVILYASENEPDRNKGIYDHGKYPIVFDVMFKSEGTPAGFGYIDIAKSTQEYIDRLDKAALESAELAARPRVGVSNACGINEDEFTDLNNFLFHAEDLSDDNFRIIQQPPINGIYVAIKENKVQELKEVTSNRDVSNGGVTSGVTAASAVAALQESSSKQSRCLIKSSYRAFREIVLLVIELIRQFYDIPRQFRIIGNSQSPDDYRFESFDNSGLVPQPQGNDYGVDMGMRLPLFDVEITAEKSSPYSRMARNELGLQFYAAGFFAPENAEQALACMEMLDFDGKDQVMSRISQNGTMYQMLMQRTQQLVDLAQATNTPEGQAIAQQVAMETGGMGSVVPNNVPRMQDAEPSITRNARQRVAESTSPV